jgi:hypothetical protein
MQQGGRPSVLEHCPDERALSATYSKPDLKYPVPCFTVPMILSSRS